METINKSVKDLVSFIYASGDLSSEASTKKRALLGTKIHQAHQATYLAQDLKEVSVNYVGTHFDYTFNLSGRIDGILNRETLILEEIKSISTSLDLIKEDTFPAHLMQAKLYAYIYLITHDLKSITVYLTYIHTESNELKRFTKRYRLDHLKKAFLDTLKAYLDWHKIYENHQFEKRKSIEGLTFPFIDYREGQYPFMGAVYQTLIKKDILYATAPTGIGKTIAAIFSGLKTLSQESEKLFYLTAKNQGKTIAVETTERLKSHGLKIKAITLNSKENMCLMDEVDCDPEICPYAKGFYNRLNDALKDIFVHDDVYDATLIKSYGEYHKICPHEFALEISNYSDLIICDYNYVFDPRIKLIRFFEDHYYKPKLLIDEAHNLVDRSRSMYSSELSYQALIEFASLIKDFKNPLTLRINQLILVMESLLKESDALKIKLYVSEHLPVNLLEAIQKALMSCDEFLTEHKKHPLRKAIRTMYFDLMQFARISEYFSKSYRFTIKASDEVTLFTIDCFDASSELKTILDESTHGTIFFSATLNPVDYYAYLLSKGEGLKFEVPSPFDPKHLGLFIDISTSTKFKDRTLSVPRIIDTIYAMLESKNGNYIAFFPSYAYMQMILDQFDTSHYEVMIQSKDMTLFERTEFLKTFKEKSDVPKILFSVLGGSFSEGIDYVGDMLHGVLVVGVALPQYNKYNELLKEYFNGLGFNGFDYAYTFPGMNKVIQAVGRVIRTDTDYGVAVLLDNRYKSLKYQALFPSHWVHPNYLYEEDFLSDFLNEFWKKKE
ncbi:MAG: ATP-dependent DNA helicase [Candidatus Izemoplasmataceae bacterium]